MASVRSVSPGGALLRASRMFSIPAPLPPCPTDSIQELRSDTATKNFPTHQAITTLNSSRKQGDWGLKRPLPLGKTTKSGQAMIRVRQVDSAEQITDYSSATDHGVTLEKFKELRLPVTFPMFGYDGRERRKLGIPGTSVFEKDTTEQEADIATKWKFQGPWLAGMSLGNFNKWLEKQVKPRRTEFHAYLKEKIAAQMTEAARSQALDKGEESPGVVDAAAVTEDQVVDYLRGLRSNGNYQELYETVGRFLDLAPLEPPEYSDVALSSFVKGNQVMWRSASLGKGQSIEMKAPTNPYAKHGPPATHPSGGISYLRTSMYLDNHPVYGPQASHPPVKARVLKPKRGGLQGGSKIGVGGFVAESPYGDTTLNHGSIARNALQHFDPKVHGGAKLWVQPLYAHVDSFGRVKPTFGDIESEPARLVALENVGEAKIFGEKEEEPAPKTGAGKIRLRYTKSRISSAENYGINGTSTLLTL